MSDQQNESPDSGQLMSVAGGIAASAAAAGFFGYAYYYRITGSTYCYLEMLTWHDMIPRHVLPNLVFGGLCDAFGGINNGIKPLVGAGVLVLIGVISAIIAKHMFNRLGK